MKSPEQLKIEKLWNECVYDYDHTSANVARFYAAARADLGQRLSEANKVIKMAKELLQYINKLDDDQDFLDQPDYEQLHETIAAIGAYEEDQPDSTHNHTSKEVREQVERWEPRIGTLERKEWQEDENRKARALLDAIPIRESEK